MANAAEKTIQISGLSNDSQDRLAGLHAVLVFLAANYSGDDSLTNPVAETIRRLRAAGLNGHFLRFAETTLQPFANRIDRGL